MYIYKYKVDHNIICLRIRKLDKSCIHSAPLF